MSTIETRPSLSSTDIRAHIHQLFGEDLHAKRVLTLSNGVEGVLEKATLGVRAIGEGLALAQGLNPKHAVKQVDRMLSNTGIDLDVLGPLWVEPMLAGRDKADVLLDWTDFAADDQTTLVLSLRTDHGRSLPLLWKTVQKSTIKGKKSASEDDLLRRFAAMVPAGCAVTILADRGFDAHTFLAFLAGLGFACIIRMRKHTTIESATGEGRAGRDWVHRRGWVTVLRQARITQERYPVGAVVTVRDKDMDQAWILVCSEEAIEGRQAIHRYGRRFTCEEMHRDVKDLRFGMGLSWHQVRRPERRDRMWLLAVLAMHLLTMLGEAGEDVGLSTAFESGPNKRRIRSLFSQGLFWYQQIPTMPIHKLTPLMQAFEARLQKMPLFRELLAQTLGR